MYIEDKEKKRFRYLEYIQYIRRLYNNGKMLLDSDFKILNDLACTRDKLDKRSSYLKQNAVLERFIGCEIEEFIVLTNSYNKLLKVAIDTSDYLKKQLGQDVEEDDIIFKTDEEALKALEDVFTDLEEIKQNNEDYLHNGFGESGKENKQAPVDELV